jgi:transglutaminase-like putative cysteine protease
MVYMGGKGKNNASRSNQTTHFGIMGGLAPSTNVAQGEKQANNSSDAHSWAAVYEGERHLIEESCGKWRSWLEQGVSG